jgi:tight adherence protein B
MSKSWITLATFASTSLLMFSLAMLIYDYFFRYRLAVRERLKELSGETVGNREVLLFRDIKRLHKGEEFQRQTWKEWLQHLIDQAGVECSIKTIFELSAGIAALLGLGGMCRTWWLAGILTPLGMLLPFAVMFVRRRVRQRKLCRQLPEAFTMISRAVRAGQTVPAALQIIAEDFDPPISTEFALCYEQQNLGISRESALRKLAKRAGIMELQIFVVAMLVQAKSGGDLVELLDNLATMIRKRLKLKDRVRALTGEGRMQALVLIILPFAGFLGILVLSPDYAKDLLDRPWLLAGTAAAQALGAFWIRRIVNFEY